MNSEFQTETLEDERVTEKGTTPEVPEMNNAKPTNKGERSSEGLVVYRASRAEEIIRIRGLAREFHAESRYGHLPFSDEKFNRVYTKAISNPHDTLAIYIQYQGETFGILHAAAGDYYLGIGGRMVTIYALYVSAKMRGTYLGGKVGVKLLRFVSEWAKSQDAEEIHIHSTSGIEPKRTDKMLTRMGFETYGGNYAARLV